MEVEGELVGRLHDLEAFGVGLHEAVLDAVVDHLDEVAGAHRADVGVPALGGQGAGRPARPPPPPPWCRPPSGSSPRQPPDPARGAGVDEADALLGQALGGGGRLLVIGVAAVDDDVAPFELGRQLGDGRVGGLARPAPSPRPPGAGSASSAISPARPPARPPWPPPPPGRRPRGRRPPPGARLPAGVRSCWRPSCPGRPCRSSSCVLPVVRRLSRASWLCRSGPAAARRRTWRRSARPRPPGRRHVGEVDAGVGQRAQHAAARRRGRRPRCGPPCRGPKGLERRVGHGVDGVGTDEGVDVEQVGVGGVLGRGGGPQRALHPGALGGQRLPAGPEKAVTKCW